MPVKPVGKNQILKLYAMLKGDLARGITFLYTVETAMFLPGQKKILGHA